ncbi:MAG: hypothetical protein ACI8S3_000836, partial [Alphaproteobacteria bacterium]
MSGEEVSMKLNADFSQRIAIDTQSQPWVASPLP